MEAKYRYSHDSKGSCQGCHTATRGVLVEVESGFTKFHLCPRCRDTKSIFERVTGDRSDDVTVLSTRSRAVTGNVPVEDQIPPMLARAFKEVKPEILKAQILKSTSWIACEKLDGVRALAYVRSGHVFFLTRNKTKGTGEYNDITANVPHLDVDVPELYGTVLDGELLFTGESLDTGKGGVVTTNLLNSTVALTNSAPEKSIALQAKFGQLKYVVFDCLVYKGADVRDRTLSYRYELRNRAVGELGPLGLFDFERSVTGQPEVKEQFYQKIVAAGGEGVMYKALNSTYCKSASSRPVSWVKRKIRYSVDGVITGFKPGEAGFTGLVGALEVSCYDDQGKLTPIAMVSSIELMTRRAMTASDGSLRSEYYGQVVEVSYQEITARAERGRHATLDKFRPDKNSADCTLSAAVQS